MEDVFWVAWIEDRGILHTRWPCTLHPAGQQPEVNSAADAWLKLCISFWVGWKVNIRAYPARHHGKLRNVSRYAGRTGILALP